MDCVELGRGLRVRRPRQLPRVDFLPEPKFIPLSATCSGAASWTCSNFYVVLSDRQALFIDYGHAFLPHMHIGADHEGLETMRFVEHHLDELRDASA